MRGMTMIHEVSLREPDIGAGAASGRFPIDRSGTGRGRSRRRALQAGIGLATLGLMSRAGLAADATIRPGPKAVLIVVDVQNCFVDGGTLPVKGGADVVPVINRLAPAFRNIVITQDWHTPEHASFASSHPGLVPLLRDGEGRGYYTAEQLSQALAIPVAEVHERVGAMVEAGQKVRFADPRDGEKIN